MLWCAARASTAPRLDMLIKVFLAVVVGELGAGRYPLTRKDEYSTARANSLAVACARMIDVLRRI